MKKADKKKMVDLLKIDGNVIDIVFNRNQINSKQRQFESSQINSPRFSADAFISAIVRRPRAAPLGGFGLPAGECND